MKLRSPIFEALAAIYEESQAGRTGIGVQDAQPTFEKLCMRAGVLEGDAYELAIAELRSVDGRIVRLDWDHPRARTTIHKVRLPPHLETDFYAALGRESPTMRREGWAALFRRAADWPVAVTCAEEWRRFCEERATRAVHWEDMKPFRFRRRHEAEFLLDTVARLLGWQGSNLVRWVSSYLCGDSKRLERRQGTLEPLLREASGGRIASFESHGILPMPREARVAGPLRLLIGGKWIDFSVQESSTAQLADLERVTGVECSATRCLTVENKTVFFDLARKRSDTLLIWTSFPNAATLALLNLLPGTLEYWHFGDTDPQGFHILHDLRNRSSRPFRPLHMHPRTHADAIDLTDSECHLLESLLKNMPDERRELQSILTRRTKSPSRSEQEHLQPPPLDVWPFYPDEPEV